MPDGDDGTFICPLCVEGKAEVYMSGKMNFGPDDLADL